MNLSTLFYNLTHIKYIHMENGLDYATRVSGNTLYIYFEDSDGALDWKNNLDFPAICHGKFFAHRGFLKIWESAKPLLKRQISDTRYSEIIISGYSHGAALAVLCHEYAYKIRPDIRDKISGYGFGCPRVLWGIKTREHEKIWQNFTVIRNIDDIVTHLPPAFLLYFHVGKILEIGEWKKYSGVDAHRPESYTSELRNAEL